MSKILKASIFENREISKGYFLLTLNLDHEITPLAGQFFMLHMGEATDPFLPRPFSFHRRISKKRIQILYRVVGKVTSNLAILERGGVIKLLGPLGNGFPLFKDTEKSLLVGGGIGIAPLVGLAERLQKEFTIIFIGGKTKDDVLLGRNLREITNRLYITTEDSSIGRAGVVTDALIDYLKTHDSRLKTVVYACGPRAMLQKVSEVAQRHNINCYVSLEEIMACGVGACMGCAVKIKVQSSKFKIINYKEKNSELRTQDSEITYKMVCKDGPVFRSDEVVWE